jgi:hypothetical protein
MKGDSAADAVVFQEEHLTIGLAEVNFFRPGRGMTDFDKELLLMFAW